MATTTANLVAVTPGGDITEDMIAGYYTWFAIAEDLVPVTKVRKAFKDAGLAVEVVPKERRPEHVLQEACRKVERVVQNGHREEIRAELVLRDKTFLIYQITRHVQDKLNRVIEHPKALRVVYNLSDGTLEFENPSGDTLTDEIQAIADEILDNFNQNGTKMPGHKLRTIVRHYLEGCNAEYCASAHYFVMRECRVSASKDKLREHHGETVDGGWLLDAMVAMLQDVYGARGFGTKTDMHKLPCVNDEGQRAYLKRKFVENCQEDLKRFRDECVELVGDKDKRIRGFRADLRDRLINQRAQMNERRQQFAEILGETLDELDRDMKLADGALTKFITEAGA